MSNLDKLTGLISKYAFKVTETTTYPYDYFHEKEDYHEQKKTKFKLNITCGK